MPAISRREWLIGSGLAALAALLFSVKGILVKLAFPYGIDATGLLGLRMAIALPCFVAVWWWMSRDQPSLSRGDLLRTAGLGMLGYHVASWLDFQGLQYVDVALERMVLYLYPTMVVLLAALLGRAKMSATIGWALALTYAGIGLTWWGHEMAKAGQQTGLGMGLVAVSALIYAVYLVGAEPLITRLGGMRFIAIAMSAACVSVLAQVLITRPLASWSQPVPVYGLALLLAVPVTVVPALLTGVAMRRIGPGPFSIIGAIGPVSTVLLGWWVLGERPEMLAWFGIALTIAGGLVISLRKPVAAPSED